MKKILDKLDNWLWGEPPPVHTPPDTSKANYRMIGEELYVKNGKVRSLVWVHFGMTDDMQIEKRVNGRWVPVKLVEEPVDEPDGEDDVV